jgi:hypothetical protein
MCRTVKNIFPALRENIVDLLAMCVAYAAPATS